jgi:hypothetical protein
MEIPRVVRSVPTAGGASRRAVLGARWRRPLPSLRCWPSPGPRAPRSRAVVLPSQRQGDGARAPCRPSDHRPSGTGVAIALHHMPDVPRGKIRKRFFPFPETRRVRPCARAAHPTSANDKGDGGAYELHPAPRAETCPVTLETHSLWVAIELFFAGSRLRLPCYPYGRLSTTNDRRRTYLPRRSF